MASAGEAESSGGGHVHERTSAAVKEAVQNLLQTGSSGGTVAARKNERKGRAK